MSWFNRFSVFSACMAVAIPASSALPNINISSKPSRAISSVEAPGGGTSANIRMQAVDLNNDGAQDIVFAAHSYSSNGLGLYWAENTTTGLSLSSHFQRHTISLTDNLLHFKVVDLDGDGDLDIAGATRATETDNYYTPYKGKHIVWYENDGQQNFTRHLLSNTEGANQLAINDFNGDGRLDIVSAYAGSVKLWVQQADKSFVQEEIFSDSSLNLELAVSAEINGDDRADIIISGSNFFRGLLNTPNGYVLKHLAQKNHCTRQNPAPYDRCISSEASHIQVLDIDQDGDDDIGFTRGQFGSGSTIGWLRQEDDHSFYYNPSEYFLAESGESINGAEWKDIDGDGDIDVSVVYRDATPAWINNDPVLAWYENRAEVGAQPEYVRHGIVTQTDAGARQITSDGFDIISADFNNDGQAEIAYSIYSNVYLIEPMARVQLADSYHQFGISDNRLIQITTEGTGTISITAKHSTIKLANLDGITVLAGEEGSKAIQFSGSEASLNNALNGLLIEPDGNYLGYDALNITLQSGADIARNTLPIWVLGVGVVLEADKHFTELQPLTLDIKLTEPVSGLDKNDFKVSGGALSFDGDLVKSDDGYLYQGKITPLTYDDVLIQLPPAKALGLNNAKNISATLLICQPNSSQCGGFDGTVPAPTDSGSAGDPTVPAITNTSTTAPSLSISAGSTKHNAGAKTFSVNNPDLYSVPFDFDQDGDLDIVSAVFGGISDGGLQWLENKGNNQLQQPNFSQHTIMSGFNAERFVIADIDADNDWDLVVVTERRQNGFKPNRQDATLWFENDGNMNFVRHDIETAQGGSSIKVGDLDGDQRLDLVIANRNKLIIRYQDRDGSDNPIFDQRVQTLINPDGGTSNQDRKMAVELTDVNNDELLDVVLAVNIATKNGVGHSLHQWINLDTLTEHQQTFSFSQVPFSSYASRGPVSPTALLSADINRDGFIDVLAAGDNQPDKMTLYINDQQGSFSSHHILINQQHEDARITDVDQDGDLDILWSSSDNHLKGASGWLENLTEENGELNLQSNSLIGGDFYTFESADINGDGINDWLLDNQWINGALKGQRANKLVQLGSSYSGHGISVADPDQGEILRLTLSLEQGSITLQNRDQIAFEQGDGIDDKLIVIRGTATNINLALEGLIYVMDPSFKGQTGLSLTVTDGVYSQQKSLEINVLAVDLQISGQGTMTQDQPHDVVFEFSNAVNGFSAGDIQVSGANTSIVTGSFHKINGARYSAQIVPKTAENIVVQVASGAAVDSDQASSSAALALFCSHQTCEFSTGTSDTDNNFPSAGAPSHIEPEEEGDVSPSPGGNTPRQNAASSGSGGGGALWILLLILPLLAKRKQRSFDK